MTSNPDGGIENAIKLIQQIARLMSDPDAGQELRSLQDRISERMAYAEKLAPEPGQVERSPEKGTCPTCGKPYAFKGDVGGIRRHGKTGRCFTDTQMAAELIPAIRLIASLGDTANGDSGDGTHD